MTGGWISQITAVIYQDYLVKERDVLNEVLAGICENRLIKIERMMEKKSGAYTELDWYIMRSIRLNATSDTAPYRHKYKHIPVDENVDWRRLNIIDEPDEQPRSYRIHPRTYAGCPEHNRSIRLIRKS